MRRSWVISQRWCWFQVVDAVHVPVIAAGEFTGEGSRCLLALGLPGTVGHSFYVRQNVQSMKIISRRLSTQRPTR